MKSVKRIISAILVVALLCGLTITSFAAGEDLSLAIYKDDGTALGSSDSIAVGDKIIVKLNAKELSFNNATLGIWFDKAVFSYDSANLSSSITAAFETNNSIICPPAHYNDLTPNEQAKKDAGYEQVRITLARGTANATVAAGEWASITLTAVAPADGSEISVLINEILYNDGEDTDADLMGLSTGAVSVKVVPPAIAATGITLDKATLSLDIGKSEALVAAVEPENSTDSVVWTSSNEAIATVSSEGLVTAVAEGTATITATAGTASATCEVTVSGAVAVTGITLNWSEMKLPLGKTNSITATVLPENATDKTVTWTSSDPSVVSVDQNGVVTGVSLGTATITASAGEVSAICLVTVHIPVTRISVTGTDVKVGHSLKLNATVEPADATDPSLTWKSAKPNIATVDQNGVVTGVAPGTAKITATSVSTSGKSGSYTITVIATSEGNYTVTMADDVSGVSVGESVMIPVTIGYKDDTVNAFNAYRMVFSYDPAALTFVSATTDISSNQFSANAADGTIIVSDYGDSKALGQAFTLKFAPVIGGETTVVLTEAQVDTGENAIAANAPEANIIDADTKINVNITYSITLPEDYTTSQSTTVNPGDDFTFAIAQPSPYYDYTVTATMGGESVEVTVNSDGTYTISNITGDVVINAPVKTAKSFSVAFDPADLSEVSGAATASYGTAYTFTINEDPAYDYAVAITVGEASYATPEPSEGTYTIPGEDIIGNILITISKTEKPPVVETFDVRFVGDGASGEPKATKGTPYSFTVAEEEEFIWKVSVTIGGETYTGYSVAGNVYTIPGEDITGDIVITTTMGVKTYSVTFTQTNGYPSSVTFRSDNLDPTTADLVTDTVEQGADYHFIITYRSGYHYEMTATMGGTAVTVQASKEYDYASANEMIEYTIANVTGNIEITLTRYMNLDVVISEYVQLDGKTVYLVIASEYNYGRTIFYENEPLFKTAHYKDRVSTNMDAYSFLLIADSSFDQAAFITNFKLNCMNLWHGTGTRPTNTIINANGDVNSSGLIDINDAQLAYDVYSGKYESFDTVTMQKYLQADVNADAKVDTLDAAAVIQKIA